MDFMELATQLGMKIREDARVQNYYTASEAYEKDENLQALVQEYTTQRLALEEEYKKDTPDDSFVEVIENRIEEIYNTVIENPIYTAFAEAQEELNEIMHMVNDELTFQVTGERHCHDHDCESCGGHCH
jgi:Predicted membrane protein